MNFKFNKFIMLIAVLGAGLPIFALSSGLQISPSNLEFSIGPGKTQTLILNIANPTADVQLFEVYPDAYQKNLVAEPSSFTLESGARKSVNITANSKSLNSDPSQTFSTNISVVAKPLAEKTLSVGTGAKVPVTVKIEEKKIQNKINYKFLFSAIAIMLLIWVGVRAYKK